MGLRQCEKCTEMVDEAKAFCPACGHALVEEEKRTGQSDFEAMDSTVQLGQTMYNQMLSDLGLDLGKSAKPEKRVEVLAPEPAEPSRDAQPARQTVQPAAPPPPQAGTQPAGSTSMVKWLVIGGAVLLFLVVALVIAAAAALIWMWPRIAG